MSSPAASVAPDITGSISVPARGVFDAALSGACTRLHLDDGRAFALPAARWHDAAGRADRWLLRQCQGPTLDIGCGPGRLVEALLQKGIPVLGVDCSALAVRYCLARGVPVLHGDVFAPLPAEGSWHHVVLADGNIGIGGDPVALLRRTAALLAPGGSVLLETGPRRSGLWQGQARLNDPTATGPQFPWAVVGLKVLPELASHAGLRVIATRRGPRRSFAQLTHDDYAHHTGRSPETPVQGSW